MSLEHAIWEPGRCCTNCLFLPASWAFVSPTLCPSSRQGRGHYQPLSKSVLYGCFILPIAHSRVSAVFVIFHNPVTYQKLYCNIIPVAILSLLLLFVTSGVHWQQVLPVALGTGNFPETTKSQLMFLRGVGKTGSIKPNGILPFLTACWWGNVWMAFAGRHWWHQPMHQASQMPSNVVQKVTVRVKLNRS